LHVLTIVMKRMNAIYPDPETAREGVERLIQKSFDARSIRVVQYEDAGPRRAVVAHRTLAPLGASLGAALGALAGGILVLTGLVVGTDLNVTDPAVGVLSAIALGAALGGFAGGVTGLSFWRKEVDVPTDDDHGVLVSVPARSEERRAEAKAAFDESGALLLV
jgi:hypothetical protein